MAAFSTLDAAAAFVNTGMADGTYITGYAARATDGVIIARVLMPVTTTGGGNWEEISDDA